MSERRDIIQDILRVQGRRMSDYPKGELFARLIYLQGAFERRDVEDKELLRYFPIALVACLESYFRLAIKHLIDSKGSYLDNAAGLAEKGQFSFEVVKALHGKTITVGDVIAHSVSLNNLAHISSHMSKLMNVDFLGEIAAVHDRWGIEVRKQPKIPIIKDSEVTYRYVSKTFELRHIFCHETATKHEFDAADIDLCFDHTVSFLKASDAYISNTLHPSAPLTQAEMNIHSSEQFGIEKARLDMLNQKLLDILGAGQKTKYEAVHTAWEQFRDISIDFAGLQYEDGSIRPTIENMTGARLTRERVDQLEKLIDFVTKP